MVRVRYVLLLGLGSGFRVKVKVWASIKYVQIYISARHLN